MLQSCGLDRGPLSFADPQSGLRVELRRPRKGCREHSFLAPRCNKSGIIGERFLVGHFDNYGTRAIHSHCNSALAANVYAIF